MGGATNDFSHSGAPIDTACYKFEIHSSVSVEK